MTTVDRTMYVSASITKSFTSGSIGLNDIGDFNNENTIVDKISIHFPPLMGGVVVWKPGGLMSTTAISTNSTRLVVPRHTRQTVSLDLPDAHMGKLTADGSETTKFVDLTISSPFGSAIAYITVQYRTKLTVNL